MDQKSIATIEYRRSSRSSYQANPGKDQLEETFKKEIGVNASLDEFILIGQKEAFGLDCPDYLTHLINAQDVKLWSTDDPRPKIHEQQASIELHGSSQILVQPVRSL